MVTEDTRWVLRLKLVDASKGCNLTHRIREDTIEDMNVDLETNLLEYTLNQEMNIYLADLQTIEDDDNIIAYDIAMKESFDD